VAAVEALRGFGAPRPARFVLVRAFPGASASVVGAAGLEREACGSGAMATARARCLRMRPAVASGDSGRSISKGGDGPAVGMAVCIKRI
jgi:hypothetical protein